MRASAKRSCLMVLSLAMSCGRITPCTESSRNSALTRTSCRPLTTRLPLGSTCVTVAARRSVTVSPRFTVPLPSLVWPPEDSHPEHLRQPELVVALARALGAVLELRFVLDGDQHGDDVAHRRRPLVPEEG